MLSKGQRGTYQIITPKERSDIWQKKQAGISIKAICEEMNKNYKTVQSLQSDTKKREYRGFVEAFKEDKDEVISLIPKYESLSEKQQRSKVKKIIKKWTIKDQRYIHLIPTNRQSSDKKRIFDEITENIVGKVKQTPQKEQQEVSQTDSTSFQPTPDDHISQSVDPIIGQEINPLVFPQSENLSVFQSSNGIDQESFQIQGDIYFSEEGMTIEEPQLFHYETMPNSIFEVSSDNYLNSNVEFEQISNEPLSQELNQNECGDLSNEFSYLQLE